MPRVPRPTRTFYTGEVALARDACFWVAFKRLLDEAPDMGNWFTDRSWALGEAYDEGQILPPADLGAEYLRQISRAMVDKEGE